MVRRQEALGELLRYLKDANYRFVAVTPATHARVLARLPLSPTAGLRDIFGWNRSFRARDVSPEVFELLKAADALDTEDGLFRSRVRVARLGEDLMLHSAFPTDDADSVFFGPDTYRFARFVQQQLPRLSGARWLVDMGTGSGAGAIVAAKLHDFDRITIVDTNARALELASVNVAAAAVDAEPLLSDAIPSGADLIIANPPYMMDSRSRSYRDGGSLLGGEVAANWVRQATTRLAPGGAMLLYTGAAFVEGESPLVAELATACASAGATFELSELDPDVFGDELDQPQYGRVERIAAIGVVIRARAARHSTFAR